MMILNYIFKRGRIIGELLRQRETGRCWDQNIFCMINNILNNLIYVDSFASSQISNKDMLLL